MSYTTPQGHILYMQFYATNTFHGLYLDCWFQPLASFLKHEQARMMLIAHTNCSAVHWSSTTKLISLVLLRQQTSLHQSLPVSLCVSLGSCLAAVERAVAETDVGAILPLGRQHSLLNIINVVIQKLGHLINIYLDKVLQIMLCVTASVSTVLDKRDQVSKIWTDSVFSGFVS